MRGRRAIRAMTGGCLVVAAVLALAAGWRSPGWWAAPALIAAVGAAELVAVPLAIGRQRWRLTLAETVVGLALVVAPGGWLVLSAGVGTMLATQARHLPRLNAAFDAARATLAVAAAVGVALLVGAPLPGAVAGLLAYVAVTHLLSYAAVAVTARRSLWHLLRAGSGAGLLQPLGNAGVGVLAGELLVVAPLGLVALVVPLALVWSAYDQQRRREAEVASYAELVRGQEQTSGRSVDVSAGVVLMAAARLLGGADVELVLRHPAGPVRYVGDEYGVRDRAPVDGAAFDAGWALRALGSSRVVCGTEDGRPYVAAAISGAGAPSPIAVLGAWRPGTGSAFGRADLLAMDALVAQAAAWLSVSELAGAAAEPDLGPAALPALRALRESTHRLARLAQRPDGTDPVGAIVDELHVTERAVAALLGAASARPADVAVPAPRASAVEWTTTGVLR